MRARWKITLEVSKEEAILAVDLYNQPNRPRCLEGFFVHIHMAWLYLFQAYYQREHIDYCWRQPNGRYERINNEPRTWELAKFTRERWREDDPVRKNLELTIALRNKIEHRYENATSVAVAGYAQAMLLNFEDELTTVFGDNQTLGDQLRFPVFVGTFSREGAVRIAAVQQQLPSKTRQFITRFQADLDSKVIDDQRFEFRVHLIPKTGAKAEADVALTYVRETDLSEEQRQALADIGRTGTVIVREQIRDVANADKLKPAQAAKAIQARIPFKFSASSHFPRAWKALEVRPPTGDSHPERTRTEYCVYDGPHNDYVYTHKFVDKVVSKVSTEDGFRDLLGMKPTLKKLPTS
jgi:hypothetical protein